MIAQLITFQGEQIGLLAAQPNWNAGVRLAFEMPVDIAKEPITLQESRRVFAQSARYAMSWRAYLSNAKDATELRIFLTRIRGETVAAPVWPDHCLLDAAVATGATLLRLSDFPVRHGVYFLIADAANFEILTATSVTDDGGGPVLLISPGVTRAWANGCSIWPLMFGRLTDQPKPEAITDETVEVDLRLKENSQFARRISPRLGGDPVRVVGSHIPTFQTTPLWVVPPNYVRPLDWTEQPDVIYEQVGFLREEQKRVYDHRNPRAQEFEFYECTRNNIWLIERLFRILRGPTLRMMIPTFRGDMRLAANTTGSRIITVEPTEFARPGREPQPGDPFIALIDAANAIDPYQIASVTQWEDWSNLNITVNVSAYSKDTTILSHLLLARFLDSALEWTYMTDFHATTRLKFVELPHEYASPPAALPEPAYLFIFTETLPVPQVSRFTSYENTIVVPSGAYAGTYAPAPFSFGTIRTGLKLDQETLELKSFKFMGNPLNKMWPFALDGLLQLDVVEVNAANPQSATARHRFWGDVWTVDSEYNATAVAFGNFFERKFPRFLMSVSDNYTQFSPPTNLAASAFKISGIVGARSGQQLNVPSAPAYAKPTDYFAGGWLETGTGANFERRGILRSAPVSPGGVNGVQLYIDRPLLKVTGGPINLPTDDLITQDLPETEQPIDLYPGYDGSIDQCESRFNNRINFGGHPYIPSVNPAVKAMKAKEVKGGKKG